MPTQAFWAERASHADHLAAAFLLAYKRRDETAMQSVLEDVGGDIMPFCMGMASIAQTMLAQTVGLRLWQEFLESRLNASADSPTNRTTAERTKSGDA